MEELLSLMAEARNDMKKEKIVLKKAEAKRVQEKERIRRDLVTGSPFRKQTSPPLKATTATRKRTQVRSAVLRTRNWKLAQRVSFDSYKRH